MSNTKIDTAWLALDAVALELQAMLLAADNEALKAVEGHVYQVWEDGEVTLTKSGSLYGQRNLHQRRQGHPVLKVRPLKLPHPMPGNHTCVFVPQEVAERFMTELWGF